MNRDDLARRERLAIKPAKIAGRILETHELANLFDGLERGLDRSDGIGRCLSLDFDERAQKRAATSDRSGACIWE